MTDKLHFQFQITSEDRGQRLDEFLWSRFGGLSRLRVTNLVAEGACTVNGGEARSGLRLAVGDAIEFAFEDSLLTAMSPEPIPLEVLYEDDHIIVVVKPTGMVVHPTRHVKSGTLANALTYHFNRDYYSSRKSLSDGPAHGEAHSLVRPGIIHRLDRATSGLMVVARADKSLSALSRHFRRRMVEKRYLALALGRLSEDEGAIIAPIGRNKDGPPHWWVIDEGKPAETRYRVLERADLFTLVELEPVTGRTNQLRIHCAYSGHPLLGDETYFERGLKDQPARVIASAPRLCLHAWRLAFHHPATGEWVEFTSPLPDAMASLLDKVKSEE